MVKYVMLALSFMSIVCMAEPLTNVAALVGVRLTDKEIARLPSCDSTSPDTVFLGTVKALRTGNLRELYYHFEANYLYSLTGLHDLKGVSEETASSFRSVMSDGSFSNIVIMAYSVTTSNHLLRVASSLRENYSCRTLENPFALTVRKTTSGWKVVSYDDDKWND